MNPSTSLAIEYKRGESDGSALIKSMDNLVRKIVIARWGHFPENNYDDLLQEGRLAVLDAAANRFDASKGLEFTTFAYHRITHAVNSAGPGTLSGVTVPWGTLNKYRRAMRAAEGDENAAMAYAKEELSMTNTCFLEVHGAIAPVSPDHLPNIADVAEQVAAADMVDRILEGLPPAERSLFSMFYGIEDGNPRTAEELGKLTGRSAQDIRNELSRSRRRLRGLMSQMDY